MFPGTITEQKKEPPVILTPRMLGAIGSARNVVVRKARAQMECRLQIRAMLEASPPEEIPRPSAALVAARQRSPKRAQAVAVAVVLEVVSSIAAPGQSGQPDDLG